MLDATDIFIKWGASTQWSFGPNSARGRLETSTIENTQVVCDTTQFINKVMGQK